MKIRVGGDHIADIDADAKSDAHSGRCITIVIRYKTLHLRRAADGAIDAIEHNQ